MYPIVQLLSKFVLQKSKHLNPGLCLEKALVSLSCSHYPAVDGCQGHGHMANTSLNFPIVLPAFYTSSKF